MPPLQKSAVERRSEELDTIGAVLPVERRDELAELLTEKDIETLRHLVNQGMGDNTLRALTSDLAYLEAWGLAATGKSLPWPAPEALLLKFVAHHLWDPQRRETVRITACLKTSTRTCEAKDSSNRPVRTRQRRCAGGWRTGRR